MCWNSIRRLREELVLSMSCSVRGGFDQADRAGMKFQALGHEAVSRETGIRILCDGAVQMLA